MSRLDHLADLVEPALAERTGACPGAPLLVAVSGGVDSTAMALVLARLAGRGTLPGPLALAHVNHAVHGSSDVAEEGVADLAARLGLPFHVRRLRPFAGHPSEAMLREHRYAALIEIAEEIGARWVLTGHTADDNVETILFRMMRGAGPAGLAGIPAARPLTDRVTVVRPFLDCRRAELAAVIEEAGEVCTEDPTNADLRYARNRIRQRILPALRRDAGGEVDASLLRLAEAARRVAGLLADHAGEVIARRVRVVTPWRIEVRMSAGDAAERAVTEEVFRQLLQRLSHDRPVPWSHVERCVALLAQPAGKRLQGPEGPLVERTRWGVLLVDPAAAGSPPDEPAPVAIDGPAACFGSTEWTITAASRSRETFAPSRDRCRVLVDPARAPLPWSLRTRRRGERFHPLGMPGPVELTRFLSRRHVPRFDRDRLPLVVDRQDRIVWVPGAEISAAVRVTDDTESCVELRTPASGGAGPGNESY